MGSKSILFIIISLVCVSVLVTFIFISRFTKEEFHQISPIPPSIPEVPEKTVKSVFYYPPEIYRDPFKAPIRIRPQEKLTEKEIPKQEIPKQISLPKEKIKPVVAPSKESEPLVESKSKITQVENRASEIIKTEQEMEVLPRIVVTGIIYDSEPFAILEFNGESGIFVKGDNLSKDLLVKDIYRDSVDIDWKGKIYNIKLGGN